MNLQDYFLGIVVLMLVIIVVLSSIERASLRQRLPQKPLQNHLNPFSHAQPGRCTARPQMNFLKSCKIVHQNGHLEFVSCCSLSKPKLVAANFIP